MIRNEELGRSDSAGGVLVRVRVYVVRIGWGHGG